MSNAMRKILIVEDELLVALDLEDILTQSGYEVLGIVADLKGASEVDRSPVVAMVDLNLRDGATGYAVARQLADEFGTKTVFVTANPAQISEPPHTAVGYVQKPFRAAAVLTAVEAALANDDEPPEMLLRAFD